MDIRFLPLIIVGALFVGCSDDGGGDGSDNGGDSGGDTSGTINGVCIRDDSNGSFCIDYIGVPQANASAVETGCTNDWGTPM